MRVDAVIKDRGLVISFVRKSIVRALLMVCRRNEVSERWVLFARGLLGISG